MRRFLPALLIPALLLPVALLGCSSDGDGAGGDTVILTADEALEEYREQANLLELVPGDTFAVMPISLSPLDEQGNQIGFEAGVGAQAAQFQWYCSWAKAALADPAASEPVARLETFSDLSVWDKMDDNGHRLFDSQLAQAKLGNFTPLSEYVTANCA